jgi:CubicO group peptidase (beta-lactamase class C family)
MNGGKWGNEDIFAKEWADESLRSQVERPGGKYKGGGYGFQFWTQTETVNNRSVEIQDAKGNGGQRISFCKSLNLLVVITAGNYNQWDIINNSEAALTKYIIPATK